MATHWVDLKRTHSSMRVPSGRSGAGMPPRNGAQPSAKRPHTMFSGPVVVPVTCQSSTMNMLGLPLWRMSCVFSRPTRTHGRHARTTGAGERHKLHHPTAGHRRPGRVVVALRLWSSYIRCKADTPSFETVQMALAKAAHQHGTHEKLPGPGCDLHNLEDWCLLAELLP